MLLVIFSVPDPDPHVRREIITVGGDTLAGQRGEWGVNILEDERHRIALLQ
jgi:hypothetical protein